MRLYGKNPVIERLKADPQSVKKIYLQLGHEDAGYVYKKAKKWGIPVHAGDVVDNGIIFLIVETFIVIMFLLSRKLLKL